VASLTPVTDRAVGAVVFDLDGTLVDSCADIARAANVTLERHGRPPRTTEEIRGFIGDGGRMLLARAAGLPERAPELDPLVQTFLAYYSENALNETRLFDGVLEVLERLAALPRCLCTNKPRAPTLAVLRGLGIEPSFDVILAGDDLPQKKPDPALLRELAGRVGVSVETLVMVGDGPQDIECARAAGARSIGVVGNIVSRERLMAAQPDVVVPLRAVPDVIAAWQKVAPS
jgi:phosphoglycolate phosphatase